MQNFLPGSEKEQVGIARVKPGTVKNVFNVACIMQM